MAKRHFLILGGCGFIGSNFVHLLHERYPDSQITVFDLLTYAGSLDNLADLADSPRLIFLKGDLAEISDLARLTDSYDFAINFAAETHVDRSLYDPTGFVRSNVLGVVNLLVWCREQDMPLLQISTDEVYGPSARGQAFDEEASLQPTSPYAASKAAADLMVQTAIKTFDQRAAIVRTCNNYGPHQYPEKLIPLCIDHARRGLPLPIYGDGKQRRCWLHVEDFCAALLPLLDNFPQGEIINIGSESEMENLSIVQEIIEHLRSDSEIAFVADRPGHDQAYRINSGKYAKMFGAIESRPLAAGLEQTIDWYLEHPQIFARLDDAETKSFFDQHYDKPERS